MKLRVIPFLLCLILFSSDITFAQSFTLSGTVTDNSGDPIEEVSIYVSENSSETGKAIPVQYQSKTSTNGQGQYSIRDLTSGKYIIIAYYPGK